MKEDDCVCACAHTQSSSFSQNRLQLIARACVGVGVCVCVGGWVGACARLHIHASEFKCPIACQGVVHSTDIQV